MTDQILISKFLTKHYSVLVTGGAFCFQDKENKRVYTSSEFTILFKKIFSYELTDDCQPTLVLAQIWLDARKYEITEKIYDYLAGCTVKLGPQTWETYNKNNCLVTERTISALADNGSIAMLYCEIFEQWHVDKVYAISEKMLQIYN